MNKTGYAGVCIASFLAILLLFSGINKLINKKKAENSTAVTTEATTAQTTEANTESTTAVKENKTVQDIWQHRICLNTGNGIKSVTLPANYPQLKQEFGIKSLNRDNGEVVLNDDTRFYCDFLEEDGNTWKNVNEKKLVVNGITSSSDKISINGQIKLGMTESEVTNLLGQPVTNYNGTFEYYNPNTKTEPESEVMNIIFTNGEVSKINMFYDGSVVDTETEGYVDD